MPPTLNNKKSSGAHLHLQKQPFRFRTFKLYLILISTIIAVLAITPYPQAIITRLSYLAKGIHYKLYCDDLTPREPPPPKSLAHQILFSSTSSEEEKITTATTRRVVRLVFIRHGQSVWNTMANASSPWAFITSVSVAVFNEIKTIFTAPTLLDSAFYDAKLTEDIGVQEAIELSKLWNSPNSNNLKKKIFSADRNNNFTLVTSNLRRAIDTARIIFDKERLKPISHRHRSLHHHRHHHVDDNVDDADTRLIIDSTLQEGCCHIDAMSFQDLTPSSSDTISDNYHQNHNHHFFRQNVVHFNNSIVHDFKHQINYRKTHEGNRGIGYNLWKRQDKFVERLFRDQHRKKQDGGYYYFSDSSEGQQEETKQQPKQSNSPPVVIVVGHSSWFKRFFAMFITKNRHLHHHEEGQRQRQDTSSTTLLEKAGIKKMTNCGVTKFDLVLDLNMNSGAPFIDEESFEVLYGDLV